MISNTGDNLEKLWRLVAEILHSMLSEKSLAHQMEPTFWLTNDQKCDRDLGFYSGSETMGVWVR